MNQILQAVPVSNERFLVNAIVKVSGVTSDGLARLMTVLGKEQMKPKAFDEKDVYTSLGLDDDHVDEVSKVDVKTFRFAKVLEVKPESDRETYLVTLKIF